MHEEQRAQIARDAEIARQWDEEERKRAMDEAESTKKIDWNDPSVLRYHSLKMKPKSIAQARRNMRSSFGISIKNLCLWMQRKQVRSKSLLKKKGLLKDCEEDNIKKKRSCKQEEREEVVKEPAAKRKKSIPRKTTRKRQKLEEDTDKDELKTFLDIVPREYAPIEVDSLSTKFPIVDWKTVVLTGDFMYYKFSGCWRSILLTEKEVSLESRDVVKDGEYKIGADDMKLRRWVKAKKVSPEVEHEKWRRLILRKMCVAVDVSTDGREEDFFSRNGE
ncbi:hypothetical protein Tco_0668936 [Tanacetum coccineum]